MVDEKPDPASVMATQADVNRLTDRLTKLEQDVAALKNVPAPTTTTIPQNLQATVVGSTVELRWSPPSAGTPNGYIVEGGSSPNAVDALQSAITPTPTWRAINVSRGRYYVRIRAVYPNGYSEPSNEIVVDVK